MAILNLSSSILTKKLAGKETCKKDSELGFGIYGRKDWGVKCRSEGNKKMLIKMCKVKLPK